MREATRHAPYVRQLLVTEVTVVIGEGTEESLARRVCYYFGEEGELLAYSDPTEHLLDEMPLAEIKP